MRIVVIPLQETVECPDCEGRGKVAEYWGDNERWYGCTRCGGHGDVSVDLDGYEKEDE